MPPWAFFFSVPFRAQNVKENPSQFWDFGSLRYPSRGRRLHRPKALPQGKAFPLRRGREMRAGNARPYEFYCTSGGERRGGHWSPTQRWGMKNRPLNESVQRASGSWYGEPFCWETLPGRGRRIVRGVRNIRIRGERTAQTTVRRMENESIRRSGPSRSWRPWQQDKARCRQQA